MAKTKIWSETYGAKSGYGAKGRVIIAFAMHLVRRQQSLLAAANLLHVPNKNIAAPTYRHSCFLPAQHLYRLLRVATRDRLKSLSILWRALTCCVGG